MDFFAHQDRARAMSRRLGWLFALAVIATLLTVNLATWVGFELYLSQQARDGHQVLPEVAFQQHLLIQGLVTAMTIVIIGGGSLYKTLELSGGGPAVASMLGGEPIDRLSNNARHRQLVNVVEEMAIASGVPMPQVYVLPNERGINAFAAGHAHGDAVVAVTAGALDRFNRDELQGVIGHEFSHILNGDMRINLRLMGLIHGILVMALTGRLVLRLMRGTSSSKGKGGGAAILIVLVVGVTLVVIGYIGYFFGQLIKAAISRQREFLADASAVQFTRNPGGIANALKKLGSGSMRSRLVSARANEASHLFFGLGVGQSLFGMLATHPPLAERIRAIEPRWDGNFSSVPEQVPLDEPEVPQRSPAAARTLAFAPEAVTGRVGSVTPEQVAFGAALLATIPTAARDAAAEPFAARAVVLALMLDPEPAKALIQFDLLERDDPVLAKEIRRLHPLITKIGDGARLPLVSLAQPALRRLSAGQRDAFLATLTRIVQADGIETLAEFCLSRLVRLQLTPPVKPAAELHAMRPLLGDLSVLLSALAHAGAVDPAAAKRAFSAATAKLVLPNETLDLWPAARCDSTHLDAALTGLSAGSPGIKRRVVTACANAVAADGQITVREAEMLRVVALYLGCPLPPFADQPAS